MSINEKIDELKKMLYEIDGDSLNDFLEEFEIIKKMVEDRVEDTVFYKKIALDVYSIDQAKEILLDEYSNDIENYVMKYLKTGDGKYLKYAEQLICLYKIVDEEVDRKISRKKNKKNKRKRNRTRQKRVRRGHYELRYEFRGYVPTPSGLMPQWQPYWVWVDDD